MYVRVLGELEVTHHGMVLTPSAPKLRRVFALLAVQANRVVRIDQLIEELWEDRPPFSAITTLQTYIYQLRKLLGWSAACADPAAGSGACEVALRTNPGGYLLNLPEGSLDAEQFERLAQRGRDQLASGDHEAASRTLRRALGLWTGRAFGAVSTGPLLQTEMVRLEELRKIVLGYRIEADLHLGRHADLIGELTTLVARQPTHEGFQAKLMLGLYRAGRRSEALQVYQRARAALISELGLEPSAELRQLHRAMLAADPALDAPGGGLGTAHITARREPPNQLPLDVTRLVGREGALQDVRRVLTGSGRSAPAVALAVGVPGSGKSAFAVHAGHQVSGSYPDGVLYERLQRPDGSVVPVAEVLASFLRALGLRQERGGTSQEEMARMFRSWTAGRRLLVVLDDVVDAQQLHALLPAGPGCAVIASSRRLLVHPAVALTVHTTPLDPDDCREMLADVLGAERLAADGDRLPELIALSGGLPTVLRSTANLLQLRPHWSVGQLLDRTRGDVRRIALLSTDDPDITESVKRTYRLLTAEQQAAFRAVAAGASGSIRVPEIAQLFGADEAQAELLLEKLVEFQLVEAEDVGGAFEYAIRPAWRTVAAGLTAAEAAVLV
uniref:Putative transcriptional activator, SARP family n=1 Tax=Streptomyces tendae TaxID=1932 RepID=A7DWL6_STRTE|nr:putative transcriptional activator, SARP family [Streptomyces tendae]